MATRPGNIRASATPSAVASQGPTRARVPKAVAANDADAVATAARTAPGALTPAPEISATNATGAKCDTKGSVVQ